MSQKIANVAKTVPEDCRWRRKADMNQKTKENLRIQRTCKKPH